MEVADRLWLTLCGEPHNNNSLSLQAITPSSTASPYLANGRDKHTDKGEAAKKIQAAYRGASKRSSLLVECLHRLGHVEERYELDIKSLKSQLLSCEARVAYLETLLRNDGARDGFSRSPRNSINEPPSASCYSIWNSVETGALSPLAAFSTSSFFAPPSPSSSSSSSQKDTQPTPLHSIAKGTLYSPSIGTSKPIPLAAVKRVSSWDFSSSKPQPEAVTLDASKSGVSAGVYQIMPTTPNSHSAKLQSCSTIKLQMPPANGLKAKLARTTCATKAVDTEKQLEDSLLLQAMLSSLSVDPKSGLESIVARLKSFPESKAGGHLIQLIKYPKDEQEKEYKALLIDILRDDLLQVATLAQGSAIVQRCLEFSPRESTRELLAAILLNLERLSQDQYGCYIVQRALDESAEDQYLAMVRKLLELASASLLLKSPPFCLVWQHLFQVNSVKSALSNPFANLADRLYIKLKNSWGALAQNEHGSLVAQSVFEHDLVSLRTRELILNELLQKLPEIAQSQWGFWVIHHLLNNGLPKEKSFLQQMIPKGWSMLQKQVAGLKPYEQAIS